MSRWAESWNDNLAFLIRELFLGLTTVLMQERKFESLDQLLRQPYFLSRRVSSDSGYRSFGAFDNDLRSLDEYRNRRLSLNRMSLSADLIKEHADLSGPDFQAIIDADLMLFVRSTLDQYAPVHNESLPGWWYPRTLVYRDRTFSSEFVGRLRSTAFFEEASPLLGVDGKDELGRRLAQIPQDEPLVHMGFTRILGGSLGAILELDSIGTVA